MDEQTFRSLIPQVQIKIDSDPEPDDDDLNRLSPRNLARKKVNEELKGQLEEMDG